MGDSRRLQASASTPQELFEQLAHQLSAQMIDPQDIGSALREKIAVEADSLELLLREWIRVLLDLVRVQKILIRQVRVTAFQLPGKRPASLQAEVVGELADPLRHTLSAMTPALQCRRVQCASTAAGYEADVDLAN